MLSMLVSHDIIFPLPCAHTTLLTRLSPYERFVNCMKKSCDTVTKFFLFCFLPVEPLSSPLLLDNNLYEAEVRFFSFDYRINANYSVTQLLCHWRNAQALCSVKQEKTLAFNREALVLKQSSLTPGESRPGRGDSRIKRTGVLVGNFE